MPEIGELGMKFIALGTSRRAPPEHLPFLGIEQPGDGANQRRLAGAVLAGQQHTFAGLTLEAQAPKHMTITAPQVNALNGQHFVSM